MKRKKEGISFTEKGSIKRKYQKEGISFTKKGRNKFHEKRKDQKETLVSFIINIVFSTTVMEALRAKDTEYIFQLSGYNL